MKGRRHGRERKVSKGCLMCSELNFCMVVIWEVGEMWGRKVGDFCLFVCERTNRAWESKAK
jgi:hypothetical protein